MDKEYLIEGLLKYNYLPNCKEKIDELPPFFSSITFNKEIAQKLKNIFQCNKKKRTTGYNYVNFNIPKFNGNIRHFSIPHPIAYANLSLTIYENWDNILNKVDIVNNKNSKCKPSIHPSQRIIIMSEYEFDNYQEKHMNFFEKSFLKQYMLKLDIANFFPSIYTHSITWALIGKQA